MRQFETVHLGAEPDAIAPDGTLVRLLPTLAGGSVAHFELAAQEVSHAVTHKTVEEIWFFLSGRGEMWRRSGGREEIVAVEPGLSVTIPLGTAFQFRAIGEAPLKFLALTMPPWPGPDEAERVVGAWTATVSAP